MNQNQVAKSGGIKITPRAFGRDRRLPITNQFKEW